MNIGVNFLIAGSIPDPRVTTVYPRNLKQSPLGRP